MDREEDTTQVVARPYQLELLECALESNTIVLLGTGSGKTFIAVMLLKQLSYMILGSYKHDSNSKRTIFLVNTVPLVKQQADYIKKHSNLNVGMYYGEMGVDDWKLQDWIKQLEDNNVLVMTRQIFLNMLTFGYIHISRVNLLIFDECHHAVKCDPYVGIMRHFQDCRDVNQRPRILGLSASIISGKCKPFQLEKKLKDLEVTLCSHIETAKDLVEVAKYATNPDEVLVQYSSQPNNSYLFLKGIIDNLMTSISHLPKLKNCIEDCKYILDNIGTLAASQAAEFIITGTLDILTSNPEYSTFCPLVERKLREFKSECTNSQAILSSKTDRLIQLLVDAKSEFPAYGDNKLCGIIFVEQKVTAVCLMSLITSHQNSLLSHVKCGYIVGHTGCGSKVSEHGISMNVKKQQEVLRKFRSGEINMLIATSVIEEGLDVPKCNLVIRFDFPKTFQSHIQSKGRARAKNSKYVILINSAEAAKQHGNLINYLQLERHLSEICHDRQIPGDDEVERRLRHIIPPYQPYGTNGPTVTIDESLSLLHKYCQKLPSDRFTVNVPDFKTEKISNVLNTDVLYKVTINLPTACPLKETIECDRPCQSMELAKKAAALKAIKMLHIARELDEHLKPITHEEIDSDKEDVEKMTAKKIKHAGTHKRALYYRNKTASCLGKTPTAQVTSRCYLYTFTMERSMNEFRQGSSSTPNFQNTNWSILTCNPIPYKKIQNFSLYIEHSEVFVSIKEQKFPFLLGSTELDILKQFHQTVFCKILKFEEFKFSSEMSDRGYLIVPILTSNSTKYSYLEEAKNIVRNLNKKELFMPPHESTDLLNSVVIKSYTTNDTQFYEVIEVNKNETPQSPFPDDPSITYMQYFAHKYNFQIKNAMQYSLTCKALSMSFNKLVSSCKVRNLGRGRQNQIKLFPELCKVLPLSASQWKSYSYIPSILYRLEAFLLMNELSDQISISSNIGLSRIGEYTTYSDLSAEDFTSTPLRSALFRRNSRGEVFIEEDIVPIDGVLRKPDNALLLRSFTTCSANDIINLERLESLGDSFLKLSTTIDLFCSRDNDHEGKLTSARERRISNFNLCHLAKKKCLQMRLFTSPFENWVPPGFVLNDSMPQICPDAVTFDKLPERVLKYFYHRASDKNIADGVEAMLGAYIIAGGIECGLKWLQWLGMKLNTSHDEPMVTNASYSLSQSSYTNLQRCEMKLPLLINGSCDIFHKQGYMPRSPLLIPPGECANEFIVKYIGSCFKPPRPLIGGRSHNISLCEKLEWEFRDQSLLLQALTHPSFIKNRMTDNYQRLEFLGDAVLDYLVTCYIFCEFPNYTPGQITDARSALVNNITFAEIAVKELELHKHLLYLSPALFNEISEYVEFIENDADINDEVNVELYCNSKSDENITPTASTSSDDQTGNDEVEEIEPPKVLGDVLESLAGALFLDSNMNLELVWSKFYPFFKPIIDKFSSNGPPVHPIAELLRLDPNAKFEPSSHRTKHRCTITVIDKDIQVTCTAKNFKTAKYGAAKRIIDKINSNISF